MYKVKAVLSFLFRSYLVPAINLHSFGRASRLRPS